MVVATGMMGRDGVLPIKKACLSDALVSDTSPNRVERQNRGSHLMAELKNRQWLLASRPEGMIKESDFRWSESTTPALKDGEVLVRNLAFSFDPTQRGWMSMDTYMPAIPVGEVMKAGTIGQVVES